MIKQRTLSRRRMLGVLGAAAAAPMFIPSTLLGENAPSKRITLGFIGVGHQGRTINLNGFLNLDDCQVVTLCDVQAGNLDLAREFVKERGVEPDFKFTDDYRDVLSDPSIDAVVISTPDHWHVPMTLLALEAGKDVFCEKPTLTIEEGTQLVETVKKHDKVFQMGMEDRSKIHFHKMIEWIRNGEIGSLERVEVTLPKGIVNPLEEPCEVPEDINYNLWLGPAPFHPFSKSRLRPHHWRNIRAYSNGKLTDWGAHLVDTAQLAVQLDCGDPRAMPVEVRGTGTCPKNSMTDVPVEFNVDYRYAGGVELNVKSGADWSDKSATIRCIGTKGELAKMGWHGAMEAKPKDILRRKYAPGESTHWELPPYEHPNFAACVKSRKPTTYTAETMLDLCNTLNMGLIAIDVGRTLKWDNQAARFTGDPEANAMCSRRRRDWLKGM